MKQMIFIILCIFMVSLAVNKTTARTAQIDPDTPVDPSIGLCDRYPDLPSCFISVQECKEMCDLAYQLCMDDPVLTSSDILRCQQQRTACYNRCSM